MHWIVFLSLLVINYENGQIPVFEACCCQYPILNLLLVLMATTHFLQTPRGTNSLVKSISDLNIRFTFSFSSVFNSLTALFPHKHTFDWEIECPDIFAMIRGKINIASLTTPHLHDIFSCLTSLTCRFKSSSNLFYHHHHQNNRCLFSFITS